LRPAGLRWRSGNRPGTGAAPRDDLSDRPTRKCSRCRSRDAALDNPPDEPHRLRLRGRPRLWRAPGHPHRAEADRARGPQSANLPLAVASASRRAACRDCICGSAAGAAGSAPPACFFAHTSAARVRSAIVLGSMNAGCVIRMGRARWPDGEAHRAYASPGAAAPAATASRAADWAVLGGEAVPPPACDASEGVGRRRGSGTFRVRSRVGASTTGCPGDA